MFYKEFLQINILLTFWGGSRTVNVMEDRLKWVFKIEVTMEVEALKGDSMMESEQKKQVPTINELI